MNNFLTRVVTAIVALGILYTVISVAGPSGAKVGASIFVGWGVWELKNLLFPKANSIFLVTLIFPVSWCWEVYRPGLPALEIMVCLLTLVALLFLGLRLMRTQARDPLTAILDYDGKSILGLFYIVLLPWFAVHVLDQPQGLQWFLALLWVVFAGDILAYFAGKQFGERKILPSISPKKTFAGAYGGVLGSLLAGLSCSLFVNSVPIWVWLLLGPLAGVVAQLGDFSESLFKRVADVKDSGHIMPGHGGVLDRIDGVLFAAPLFYIVSRIFT